MLQKELVKTYVISGVLDNYDLLLLFEIVHDEWAVFMSIARISTYIPNADSNWSYKSVVYK